MFSTVSHNYEIPNKKVNVLLSTSKLLSLLLPFSILHDNSTYKMKLQTAYELSVKLVSLNLSYQIHQWQNHHILGSFTILNFHRFWQCNQERVVFLDLQSNTFSCLHLVLFHNFRFVNVRHADNHNLFSFPFFTKQIFIELKLNFFLSSLFCLVFVH